MFVYGDDMKLMLRFFCIAALLGINVVAFAKKPTAPTLPAAFHNNQGVLYLTHDELQKAEFELKTAIELSPNYAEAYNNLGLVYKRMNRLDDALANFQKATQLNSRYASAYNDMGAVYIAQKKYGNAIKIIHTALKKEPSFADAYYNLGVAYLGLYNESNHQDVGKRDQAEILLKKATEINPKLLDVHTTLADLYLDKGDYEKAIIRQRVAVEQNPNDAELWHKLGVIYQRAGDKSKAKASFDEAKHIKDAPQAQAAAQQQSAAEAVFATGVAYMEQGDKALAAKNTANAKKYFSEAIVQLQAAVAAKPDLWDARYNLGLAQFQTGNTDAALKTWDDLLKKKPDYLRAVYNVGMVNWRNGKVDTAKPYLCKFIASSNIEFSTEIEALKAEMAKNHVDCK